MFPAFHYPGEARRLCGEVASSLKDWSHFSRRKDKYHLSVDLFGTSEENISLLSELMEAMATCLQDYYPRNRTELSVIIHEKSIQVGVRLFRCVINPSLLDRSHGGLPNLLNY